MNRILFYVCLLLLVSVKLTAQTIDTTFHMLHEVTVSAVKNTASPLAGFLQTQNLSSTEDILSRMQSMSLIRRGSYGQDPAIRGMTAGRINVTIDGMRIFGACTDRMDPPTIYVEPLNLKNIQVSTSQSGELAGASVGGNLNMQLYSPSFSNTKKISSNIYSSYTSISNGYNAGGDFTYTDANNAMRINSAYRKQNDYKDGNGNTILYSGFEKWNAGLSYKRKLNETSVLKMDGLLDNGWNIGYPALPMDAGFAAARIVSATYEKQLNTTLFNAFRVKGYYNSVRHYMDDTHRQNVDMHMDMPGKSEVAGAFVETESKNASKHFISSKLEWYRRGSVASMTMYDDHNNSMYMLTLPDNKCNVFAFNAKDVWRLDSVNRILISANAEMAVIDMYSEMGKGELSVFNQSQFYQNRSLWTLNISWTHTFSAHWSSGLAFSRGARTPDNNELFGYYLFNRQDGYDYIGNTQLKNETSVNAEASVKYTAGKLRIDLSVFYNKLDNYIQGDTIHGFSPMTHGANGVKQYVNISNAFLYGAEASLMYEPNCHFKIVHTSKWLQGQQGNGNYLPMIQPYKAVTAVSYTLSRFVLTLENETSAAQRRYDAAYGEDYTAPYTIFNCRANYNFTIGHKPLKVFANVENLFNRVYHEHLDWGNINRPGRNLVAGVQLSL